MKPSLFPIIGFLAFSCLTTRQLMTKRKFNEESLSKIFEPPMSHGRGVYDIEGKKIVSYSASAAQLKYLKKYGKN